ncbi:MAG: hypothetical protein H8E84_08350 [Flavobacteriales bacterium]|nr:hypothetical protein [Flavobacteriales bacterium]
MKGRTLAPKKAEKIPSSAQWLGGIGAGSWFSLEKEGSVFRIRRFSEYGDLECEGLFDVNSSDFDSTKPFEFTYLSHCNKCNIIQNGTEYKFNLINYED